MTEDANIGEQFAVVPVHGGEQELLMESNTVNDDAGIDEQSDGFSTFATAYVEQPEVSWLILNAF